MGLFTNFLAESFAAGNSGQGFMNFQRAMTQASAFDMRYEHVILEKEDDFARITINRPEKLNAMTERTRFEIATALKEAEDDKKMRSVVLTGAGDKAFSAGQDLEESKKFPPSHAKVWIRQWDELYGKIKGSPLAVVTSTPGYAVGAGWQVYLLGDYRISSENGKFAMPEIDIGIPCITGSAILKSMIGLGDLTALVLTCDRIDAQEAKRMGLVHQVVPANELESATSDAAKKLASKPPNAVKLQKEYFRKLLWQDLKAGIAAAKVAHTKAYASGEPRECMSAFLEKRTPRLERR
jgi:enoyl-CoA hydratase/carnithine racemase